MAESKSTQKGERAVRYVPSVYLSHKVGCANYSATLSRRVLHASREIGRTAKKKTRSACRKNQNEKWSETRGERDGKNPLRFSSRVFCNYEILSTYYVFFSLSVGSFVHSRWLFYLLGSVHALAQ